jgi:hypothetical protein
MENKSFFQTKEGGLTIAFIVIMIAFAMIIAGLGGNTALCTAGFVLIVAAMLYSPLKVQIYDRIQKKK